MNILSYKENDSNKLDKLTEKDIHKAENFFQVKLPHEYVEILNIQNGGELRFNALPVQFSNSWADDHIKFDHILGIKDDQGIYLTEYLLSEWGIKEKKLIIISNNGHDWIVLDYRESSDNPKVSFVDVETKKVKVLYNSFKEMLSDLYTEKYDFDFSNISPPSIENAEKMCESKDKDEIIGGLNIFVSELNDYEKLTEYLFRFTEHQDEDVKFTAVNAMHYLITNNALTDRDLINNYLKLIEKDDEPSIKYFYNELKYYSTN